METSYSFSAKIAPGEIYIIGDPFILTNEIYHKCISMVKNCAGVINNDFINIPLRTKWDYLYDTENFMYLNSNGNLAVFAYYMLKNEYQMDLRKITGIGRILFAEDSERLINVEDGRVSIYANDGHLCLYINGSCMVNFLSPCVE